MTVDEQAENIALARGLRYWLGRTGMSQKDLAAKATLNKNTIGNILANKGALPATIGNIAFALGVDVEQLFYYDTGNHEKAAQKSEEWEDNVQKVRRYLRSIDDGELRLRESRRLLKAAEVAVEEYEAGVDRARAGGKAGAADAAKPRGGGAGGAGNMTTGTDTGL